MDVAIARPMDDVVVARRARSLAARAAKMLDEPDGVGRVVQVAPSDRRGPVTARMVEQAAGLAEGTETIVFMVAACLWPAQILGRLKAARGLCTQSPSFPLE